MDAALGYHPLCGVKQTQRCVDVLCSARWKFPSRQCSLPSEQRVGSDNGRAPVVAGLPIIRRSQGVIGSVKGSTVLYRERSQRETVQCERSLTVFQKQNRFSCGFRHLPNNFSGLVPWLLVLYTYQYCPVDWGIRAGISRTLCTFGVWSRTYLDLDTSTPRFEGTSLPCSYLALCFTPSEVSTLLCFSSKDQETQVGVGTRICSWSRSLGSAINGSWQ